MDKREIIKGLQEKRAELRKNLDGILETVHTEQRTKLSDDEKTRFDTGEADIRAIDERIAELDEQIRADEAAAEVAKRYTGERRSPADLSVTEQPVYRSGPGGQSYFKDLYQATRKGDPQAGERLRRNNKMVAEEVQKRARTGDAKAQQRALTTVNGAGGEFVPPLWLESEFVRYARPGRVTANLCNPGDVPSGTDSINIPKIASGTAVAPQASQNTGVQQTDLTTTSIAASVNTVAGGQTVSMQLVEQSPLNIDDLILEDLAADYAMKLDSGQVLNGSGSGGTAMGILNLAGTTAVTWTQGTPALGGAGGLYAKIAGSISAITTSRYQSPDAIVMHPRRWWWAVSQADSTGRPLVVPNTAHPFNAAGSMSDSVNYEGPVGYVLGLPVYIDANIPTNLGAGTNQDEIIVGRFADYRLWEGNLRSEAFEQTYAQNLSLFVRVYNYVAFQAARYLTATALITGTGAVTPTF